ncbi:SGNH/GDSL hydrolase family protein [Candidatus Omnitrophota bacterium]
MGSNKKYPKYILLVTTCIICIVISEIIARVTYDFYEKSSVVKITEEIPRSAQGRLYQISNDKELLYEHIANVPGMTNSLGLRDYEYNVKKNKDIFRIVVLGDSITEAMYLPDMAQTFENILEQKLNSALSGQGKHEVINLGVGGYNASQEARYFQVKGLPLKPDLLIIGFYINDIASYVRLLREDNYFKIIFLEPNIPYVLDLPFNDFLFKRSYLYLMINKGLSNFLMRIQRADLIKYRNIAEEKAVDAYKMIGRLCRRNKIPVLVVIFPRLVEFSNYENTFQHEWIKRIAINNQWKYLDLLKVYRRYDVEYLKFAVDDDLHPNAVGHRIAADAIYEYLLESQLVRID